MDISTATGHIGPWTQPAPIPRRDGRVDAVEQHPSATQTPETQLNQVELREVEQLQQRDREVRTHEQAHKAGAGQYARGGASFDYQLGPDGKRYAVGGEVSIDISEEADPRETLEKAQTIRRAALAPADPSGQDRQIAMQATRMAAEARQALLSERMNKVVTAAEQTATGTWPAAPAPAVGQRAMEAIKAVESASLAVRQNALDHFI